MARVFINIYAKTLDRKLLRDVAVGESKVHDESQTNIAISTAIRVRPRTWHRPDRRIVNAGKQLILHCLFASPELPCPLVWNPHFQRISLQYMACGIESQNMGYRQRPKSKTSTLRGIVRGKHPGWIHVLRYAIDKMAKTRKRSPLLGPRITLHGCDNACSSWRSNPIGSTRTHGEEHRVSQLITPSCYHAAVKTGILNSVGFS